MTPEAWSALANCILAGAAVAASIAAFKGLNAWKSQIRFQNDHELARRILVTIYGEREALKSARDPFFTAYELTKEDGTPVEGLAPHEERHYAQVRAHARRWESVFKARSDINAALLEASAVWGKELTTLWEAVDVLVRELSLRTQFLVESQHPDNQGTDAYFANPADRIAARKRCYGQWKDDDEFAADFERSLKPVEQYLTTKIGRRQ